MFLSITGVGFHRGFHCMWYHYRLMYSIYHCMQCGEIQCLFMCADDLIRNRVHLQYRYFLEDVPLVEFMSLVFTHMRGESYHRQLRSLLLCLCDVFQMLINSLVCWFDLIISGLSVGMAGDTVLTFHLPETDVSCTAGVCSALEQGLSGSLNHIVHHPTFWTLWKRETCRDHDQQTPRLEVERWWHQTCCLSLHTVWWHELLRRKLLCCGFDKSEFCRREREGF